MKRNFSTQRGKRIILTFASLLVAAILREREGEPFLIDLYRGDETV